MTDSDETHLEELGFELLGRAPLVDGGLVEGTIEKFVNYPIGTESSTLNLTSLSNSSTCHQNLEENLQPMQVS